MTKRKWDILENGKSYPLNESNSIDGLQDISEARLNKHSPEIKLWISVLIDAAKHKDLKFINEFAEYICSISLLSYPDVMKSFTLMWESNANSKIK